MALTRDVRIERDVLPAEARCFGKQRGAGKARNAIHERQQHVVDEELEGAKARGGRRFVKE